MKPLIITALAIALTPSKPTKGKYEVMAIIEHDHDITHVWDGRSFNRTDIEVTKDSIIFLEYLGAPNNHVQRQARPIEECIEFIEGNNEEGEPFELTLCEGDDKVTYVLFDLQNRHE